MNDLEAANESGEERSLALKRLLDISLQLNAQHDARELLQYIVETAATLLDCEAASLLMFDEHLGQLRFVATTGSDAATLTAITVPLEGSVAGRIYCENRAIVEQDIFRAPDHFLDVDRKTAFRTVSLLGVPLQVSGDPTGVLEALNKRSGLFTDSDVEILTMLGSQAAIALRNARQISSLEEAVAKLKSFDNIKSNFLALASHELRTPLASIRGVLDLVRLESDYDVNPAMNGFLDDAIGAGEQITRIIDTMSQFHSLQDHDGVDMFETLELNRLVRMACASLSDFKPAGSHRLTTLLSDDDIWIVGDERSLLTLFGNLLENACQHTEPGGSVSIVVDHSDGAVDVRIVDSGIGIERGHFEAIFNDFYQVQDHMTRSHGGLGLGLTIAKRIAERHRGTVSVVSEGLGFGSTFTVRLPVREASPE